MRTETLHGTFAASLAAALLLGSPPPAAAQQAGSKPPADAAAVEAGKRIYDQACVYCHGGKGRGDGPVAYFLSRDAAPRPRDFTSEPFKFRSTPQGQLPLDQDLFRTVTEGRPGMMPSFEGLSAEERWQVVYYVKTLAPGFAEGDPERTPIEIGTPTPMTADSVARGAAIYDGVQCWKCHGSSGLGDGPSAPTLETTGGMHIPATNLARPSSFANGSDPEDIYRTLMTGLDGVPMPSFASFFQSDEEAWDLVNFILSLNAETR